MELCEGAGLYQIDLLNGSKERVSEAEYWARRRGQQKLDLANAALTVAGQQPKQQRCAKQQRCDPFYRFHSLSY